MRIIGHIGIIVGTLLLIHSCTNVAPTDSLTWDVNYVVPLLKEKFTVSSLRLKTNDIVDDSARSGDTLYVSRNMQLYQQCVSDIFTMPEQSNEWYRGDFVIRKLKLETLISGNKMPFSSLLKKQFVDVTKEKIIWRDTVVLRQVVNIDFGNTSEMLRAVVRNKSLTTSIRELSYSLISSSDTLLFNPVALLAPNDSAIIKAGLDGFSADDTIFIECSYSYDTENQKNDLQLSFTADFNGLQFKKAIINDSLLDFNIIYEKDIRFGQAGFNASYVDINSFKLPFTINNALPVEIKVNCKINSIWDDEYCRQNSIESANDLITKEIDSAYFKGNNILNTIVPRNSTGGNDNISHHMLTLRNARILPSWDKQDEINTLHLSIQAGIVVEGKMVTVENIERTGIQIGNPSLYLKAIYGYYTQEKRIDNPSELIPLLSQTPSDDIIKSFRNRLVPERTSLDVGIKFMFPDDTWFENIDILCRQYEHNGKDALDSMMFSLQNVTAGQKYSHKVSFNRVVERLPDSIRYSLTYIIKPFKKIYLDNYVINREGNKYFAVFDAQAEMKMRMYLVWGIIDTVSFEFDRNVGSFPLSAQNIDLMKSKELVMSVMVNNNSNIVGRLRAVQNDNKNVNNNDSVYLLGSNGLLLPARGTSKECFISFNEKDVRSITKPDSLSVKWIIDLFPCNIDALRDTDYIEINADLSLKGQHSTSSMFGLH